LTLVVVAGVPWLDLLVLLLLPPPHAARARTRAAAVADRASVRTPNLRELTGCMCSSEFRWIVVTRRADPAQCA